MDPRSLFLLKAHCLRACCLGSRSSRPPALVVPRLASPLLLVCRPLGLFTQPHAARVVLPTLLLLPLAPLLQVYATILGNRMIVHVVRELQRQEAARVREEEKRRADRRGGHDRQSIEVEGVQLRELQVRVRVFAAEGAAGAVAHDIVCVCVCVCVCACVGVQLRELQV